MLTSNNYWCGGWDDAYPTADACVHGGEPFPNLGELRSIAWEVDGFEGDETKATVKLSAFGPISAIRASKTVTLKGQVLAMSFAVESLSPIPLDFLWGTHPAFAVQDGTRLMIPARTGIVAQSNHPSLGTPGDRYNWPVINGRDMSFVPDVSAGLHCGHYATDLEDGWFAVETNGGGTVFDFPLETCPHLWLWLVYGGWRGYHHAVVEPWTGYPVNLEQAVEQGRHSQLAPGETFSVTVRCTTYSAPETHLEALARCRRD
jgi:galactose mutarotase-like enzyme